MPLRKPTGQKFETILLRPEDLEGTRQTLKITRVGGLPENLSKFNDFGIFVILQSNGVEYALGLDTGKQNYLLLFERFGEDETKWIGQTFDVRAIYSANLETDFISVLPIAKKQAAKK